MASRGVLKNRIAELEAACVREQDTAKAREERIKALQDRLAEVVSWLDRGAQCGGEVVCRRCGQICTIDGEMPKYAAWCDWCEDYAGGFDGDAYAAERMADIADARPEQQVAEAAIAAARGRDDEG